MKRKALVLLAILMMFSTAASCGLPADSDQSDNTYYSNTRMNISEYEIYINKETQPILDKLQSHLTNVYSVASGSVSKQLELQNLNISLKEVEETIANIEKIYPPIDYEDRKEQLLTQLLALKELYEKYNAVVSDTEALTDEQVKFYSYNFQSLFNNISSST